MNWKRTWIWMAVAAALVGYIAVFERPRPNTPAGGDGPAPLFPSFDPERAVAVEFLRTNTASRGEQRFRVERSGEQWLMSNPAYPANRPTVEAFLQAVGKLREYAHIPPDELAAQPTAMADFGLVAPRAAVTLIQGTNRISFHVGAKTLIGDQVYVQIIGSPGIHVTDGSLLRWLPESPNSWRQTSLLPLEGLAFDRLVVTNGPRVMELQRNPLDNSWVVTRPMAVKADARRVLYFIQRLQMAEVTQFVTDDPRADLEPYGLQTPESILTLGRGTNSVFQIQFGRSPTNSPSHVYVRFAKQEVIALAPMEIADLVKKPYSEFRDRTLLAFQAAAVSRIEARTQGTAWALQKGTNGWDIVEPFQAPADTSLAQQFLVSLAQIEVEQFEKDVVTDYSIYGLSAPARQYILKAFTTNSAGTTNQLLVAADFSTNRNDRVYARRTNDFGVYEVSFAEVARLPLAAFELRSRRVWDFAPSNLVSVTIQLKGETRKLTPDLTGAWSKDTVLNAAMEETLHRLGHLEVLSWADKGEKKLASFGFGRADHRIDFEVSKGGRRSVLSLALGSSMPGKHAYGAVVLEEGEPVIFRMSYELYGSVVNYLGAAGAAQ